MSPRLLRTVTGVFTSATCTRTLGVSLGACCSSTPGLGVIGPEGCCARAETPASVSSEAIDVRAIRFIPSTWAAPAKAHSFRECTRFDASSAEGVAASVADSYNQSSLKRRQDHARRQKTEGATRTE